MTDPEKTYYSNGKLLLTSEYFVLKGARAIALPVCFGQKMEVSESSAMNQISWKAFQPDGLWFSCKFELPKLNILQSNDRKMAEQLADIFKNIQKLNPGFSLKQSFNIETYLDFNPEWGLGSSSTLISNLSKWASVDPFQLNKLSFKGSGFDIACASEDGPILYQIDKDSVKIELSYPFKDKLFFVYSGKKKSTKKVVSRFVAESSVSESKLEQINSITDKLINVENLDEFQQLIEEHEQLVSRLVGIKPLKETSFKDFDGGVKSLGAWGGDFFLVASDLEEKAIKRYFRDKGLNVVFRWDELVLNRS